MPDPKNKGRSRKRSENSELPVSVVDQTARKTNNSMTQETFTSARKQKIEHLGTSKNINVVNFVLDSEIDTFKLVKSQNPPLNFLDQLFGHHAFSKLNPAKLLRAKKLWNKNHFLECGKILAELVSAKGLYRTFYYLIRDGDLGLLQLLIKDRNMTSEELQDVLSVCYEELRIKNVIVKAELKQWIETKLVSLFHKLREVSSIEDINKRIQFFVQEINRVALFIKELHERYGSSYDKTLIERSKLIAHMRFLLENIRFVKTYITGRFSYLPWNDLEFYIVIYLITLTRDKRNYDNIYLVAINDKIFYTLLLKFHEFCIRINVKQSIKNDKSLITENCRDFDNVNEFHLLSIDVQRLKEIFYLNKILKAIDVATKVRLNDEAIEGLVIERALQIINSIANEQFASMEMRDTLLKSLPCSLIPIVLDNRRSVNFIAKFDEKLLLIEMQSQLKVTERRIRKLLARIKFKLLLNFLQKCNAKPKVCHKILSNFTNIEMIGICDEFTNEDSLMECITRLNTALHVNVPVPINNLNKLWNLFPLGSVTNNADYINFWTVNFEYISKHMDLRQNDFNEILKFVRNLKINCDNGLEIRTEIYEILTTHILPSQHIPSHYYPILDKKYESEKIFAAFMDDIKSHFTKHELSTIFQEINARKLSYYKKLQSGLKEPVVYEILICKLQEFFENRFNIIAKFDAISTFIKSMTELPESITNRIQDECIKLKKCAQNDLQNEINEHELIYNQVKISFGYSDEEICMAMEMITLDSSDILVETKIYPKNPNFFDDYSPILSGQVLNHYLSTGDAIFEVLAPHHIHAITYHLDNVLCNKFQQNYELNGVHDFYSIAINVNNMMRPHVVQKRYEKILKWSEIQSQMFQAAYTDELDLFREAIEMEADINGVSLDNKLMSHYFLKNSYLNTDIVKCPKIHRAVLYKHHDLVVFYAKKNSNVNAKDHSGRTPLHYAAQINQVEIFKALVSEGHRIDMMDACNMIPLHLAIINGHLEVTRYIVEKGADPFKLYDIILPNSETFITNGFMLAALFDRKHIVKYLATFEDKLRNITAQHSLLPLATLNSRTEYLKIFTNSLLNRELTNNKNNHGWSLLHAATFFGATNIVELLMNIKREVDYVTNDDETVFHIAAKQNNNNIMSILLARDWSLVDNRDKFGQKALNYAIKYCNDNCIVSLIKIQTSVQTNDDMLLDAINSDNLYVISQLFDNNAQDICPKSVKTAELLYKPELPLRNWLFEACFDGNIELIEFLLRHNGNVNAQFENLKTSLHIAIEQNNIETVAYLLGTPNIDVNIQDITGETPLHVASRLNLDSILKLLVNSGKCNINIPDNGGLTPLYWAIQHFNHLNLECLLQSGVDVNAFSENFNSPLSTAILCRNNAAAKYLLEYGALPNSDSTLHRAVESNQLEVCKLLIQHGANVNSTSILGMTPLHLAAYYQRNPIMKMLLKCNALPNSQLICSVPLTMNEVTYIHHHHQPQTIDIDSLKEFAEKMFHQKTPLHFAIEKNNIEAVKMLVTHGASVNRCCSHNRNPLNLAQNSNSDPAAEGRMDDISNYLIRNGAQLQNQSIDLHVHQILHKNEDVSESNGVFS